MEECETMAGQDLFRCSHPSSEKVRKKVCTCERSAWENSLRSSSDVVGPPEITPLKVVFRSRTERRASLWFLISGFGRKFLSVNRKPGPGAAWAREHEQQCPINLQTGEWRTWQSVLSKRGDPKPAVHAVSTKPVIDPSLQIIVWKATLWFALADYDLV